MCTSQWTVLHLLRHVAGRPGQVHSLGRPIQLLEPVGRNQSETWAGSTEI
jgi:hypothetical protein